MAMTLDELTPGTVVRVRGWLDGSACYVRGPETTPEHDCGDCNGRGFYYACDDDPDDIEECSACEGCGSFAEGTTGRVIVTMVGDDGKHRVDPEDCFPLERSEWCGQCGQIGCYHDTESD